MKGLERSAGLKRQQQRKWRGGGGGSIEMTLFVF